MKRVFCIGELLIDFVAEKQGSDLSKANEFVKKAGGAPANVACAVAKLGGKSSFIGCVGNDPFGDFLLDVLKQNNVEVKCAQRSKSFTTLAFVSIAENGERDFVFSRGADKKLTYDSSIKNEFKNNIVHLGAATALLGGDLEKTYGRYFFDALTQDAFISFDPNFRGDLWRDEADAFVKKCMPFIAKADLCKFSLEEAKLISGKQDLYDTSEFLHEVGTKICVITLGEKGTFVSTSKTKETIPSIAVKTIDTTGAGDSFLGCLLQQISSLYNTDEVFENTSLLHKMVENANKAGAITTTNYGAIPSLPTRQEVFDSSEPHL